MLVGELANLASRVVARVRRGRRIAVVLSHAPGPRPTWPALEPEFEIATGPTKVTVSCSVPGATPENVRVYWDDEDNVMCIQVARASLAGPSHDWYIELPLPITVDGAKSKCTLEGTMLRIRAPFNETPTGTGLAIRALFENPFVGPHTLVPLT